MQEVLVALYSSGFSTQLVGELIHNRGYEGEQSNSDLSHLSSASQCRKQAQAGSSCPLPWDFKPTVCVFVCVCIRYVCVCV